MWMTAEVELRLQLGEKVEIATGHQLEVSIDCMVCQRNHRTVVMKQQGSTCLPGNNSKKHPFPGQILAMNHLRDGIIYKIGYYFESFVDSKHQQQAQPEIRWGRISFRVYCQVCGHNDVTSVQTNVVRPYTAHCRGKLADGSCCQNVLYRETEVYPIFRYNKTNTEEIRKEVAES